MRNHGHVRDWLAGDVTEPAVVKLLERAREQLRVNFELVDLSADAVGRVPNASLENYGDRQTAKEIGKKLSIEHLREPDARMAPLLTWGMRTVEQLLAAGHIE